jgi:hypothetical protein
LKHNKVVVEHTGSCSFLSCLYGRVELAYVGGHPGVPRRTHKGCIIAAEFATCLVLAGSVSSALAEGFIVVCVAFYEWGFGLPSHRFLCSLLRSYGLELHHLTPSRVLHMAAFVTLCEADIGIEPPLNLWSHFFGPSCSTIRAREQRPRVVWISWFAPILGLILTSPLRSLTLLSGGEKHGSC